MRRACTVGLSLAMLVGAIALPAAAAEGRIPVFLPGSVLAADGKYIVTRNIFNPIGGPAITILAADVDLELNGFTVANVAGAVDPVILVAGGDHVAIRNGTLIGGALSIDAPGPLRLLEVENVKSHDATGGGPAAFHLGDVERAVLRGNEITDASGDGILWDGPGTTKQGTIEDNLIRRVANGLLVRRCSSLAVLHNRIEELTAVGLYGISLDACSATLVAENTVENVPGEGIFIANGKGNKLLDNLVTFSGSHGIHLDRGTSNTLVLNNNSSNNGTAAVPGDGLFVEGTQNLIERNVLNSNSRHGLLFFNALVLGGACSNTFGRNTARGNFGLGSPGCPGVPPLFPPNSCNAAVGCAVANSTYGDNLIPGPPVF